MHTVVMPKMGDTMEEGKILNWLKHEGETVAKGEALAEIETEKVNIEVEAFAGGVLRKILVPAGETVPVGAPIALTGAADEPLPADVGGQPGGETTPAAPSAAPEPGSHADAAPTVVAPEPVAQPAAQPAAQQRPISLEDREYQEHTDVVGAGAVNGANVGDGAGAARGVNGYSAPAQAAQAVQAVQAARPAEAPSGGRVFISPIARHIAAEHNLDYTRIQGTGPNGRIIRDDVEAALAQQQAAQVQAAPQAPVTPVTPVPAAATGEEVRAVPLSQMRKTIAKRLQQSMQTAPHFYVTVAIDATRLGELRHSVNEYAAGLAEPVKISVNDLIVKGVALALVRMPQVNVSFDGERLLYKQRINVGIAVALEQGLIVPVIRDADKRGLLDLAKESRRLAEAARAGKLKPEEFQGGTFSISNLGMYDVEEFTAVINPPESAILAVGSIVPTPVVRDGQVVVRDIMKVTLSVDHRALDGVTAATFLQEVKRLLEQPMGMLL